MFRHGGRHLIFTSHLTGWDPNPPILFEAEAGGLCASNWRLLPRPSHGPRANTTYDAQVPLLACWVKILRWFCSKLTRILRCHCSLASTVCQHSQPGASSCFPLLLTSATFPLDSHTVHAHLYLHIRGWGGAAAVDGRSMARPRPRLRGERLLRVAAPAAAHPGVWLRAGLGRGVEPAVSMVGGLAGWAGEVGAWELALIGCTPYMPPQ